MAIIVSQHQAALVVICFMIVIVVLLLSGGAGTIWRRWGAGKRNAEMAAWIAEQGSPRLRSLLADGYNPLGVYLRERLAKDFRGAKVARHAAKWKIVDTPTGGEMKARRDVARRLVASGRCVTTEGAMRCTDIRYRAPGYELYYWENGTAIVFQYRAGGPAFPYRTVAIAVPDGSCSRG